MVGSLASRTTLDYLLLVVAAIVCGAIFSVNKIAADGGVLPLPYAFWQSFAAGLALWIILTVRGQRLGVSARHLISYLVIGGLVSGLPISLLTYVAPKLPAGIMTLVLALSPPLTFVISVFARLERFRWLGLVGLLFGFAGVALIVAPGASLGSSEAWKWFLLALCAPVMFAASNVSAAVLQPQTSTSVATGAGVMFGSAAVLLPIMLLSGQLWLPHELDQATMATLTAGGINAVFLVLFLEIIRRAGPVFFAQFNYLAVLAGVAWGAIIFSEQLSVYLSLAILLMFVGMFLSGYHPPARSGA